MHGEGSPLGGGCVKISVFHVKIPRADCLRPQPEQGSEYQYFCCEGGQHNSFYGTLIVCFWYICVTCNLDNPDPTPKFTCQIILTGNKFTIYWRIQASIFWIAFLPPRTHLLNRAILDPEAMHKSAFLRLCFFFDGFEITFIRFEWNTPMSLPFP